MKIVNVFTGLGGGLIDAIARTYHSILGPNVEIHNIADDSILSSVIAEGHVTDNIQKRVDSLYQAAADSGADLVVCTCSSIGETVANTCIKNVRIIRIDEAMARVAVATGSRIGVIATLQTTLEPTVRLVERIAAEQGKPISCEPVVAGEMMAFLKAGKMTEALATASTIVRNLASRCDVIILAQASMAAMQDALQKHSSIPVYSSPKLCAESLRKYLS